MGRGKIKTRSNSCFKKNQYLGIFMKKNIFLTIVSLLFVAQQANAVGFADYPVQVYTGKKSPINYSSHRYAKQFKTHINQAYNAKRPDFAGSYSVAEWGCGTACVNYAMIDRKNGKVYPLGDLADQASEYGASCSDIEGGMLTGGYELHYKPNSRLLAQETYCATNEQGQEIYLNKYLLWNEKSKSFSLVGDSFIVK